jgi:hypothetical protein
MGHRGRIILVMVVATLVWWAAGQHVHAGGEEDYFAKAAHAVAAGVTLILDANDALWKKVNTEQVNIAIDDLRDDVNMIDRKKRLLKQQMEQRTNAQSELDWNIVHDLGERIQRLSNTLNAFANSINQAAGSNILGDSFRNAAQDLASHKSSLIVSLPEVWSRSHSEAIAQLRLALNDTREIQRALSCLQDTINSGQKPKDGCSFGSAASAQAVH